MTDAKEKRCGKRTLDLDRLFRELAEEEMNDPLIHRLCECLRYDSENVADLVAQALKLQMKSIRALTDRLIAFHANNPAPPSYKEQPNA